MPVKTRETAPAGYRQALAAPRVVAPPSRIDPSIAEAVERQTKAMHGLGLRAFPEPDGDEPAPIEVARVQRRRAADASHAAALRRAGRNAPPGTAAAAPQTALRTRA